MKTFAPRAFLLLFLLILFSTLDSQLSAVFGQGSLAPTGAPTPTMKTLTQIEPRTPISSAPFTISVPGSYYLTANVSVSTGHAITISTSNVTLDLNGYTISSSQSPAASGAAVFINTGFSNIAIMNGYVNSGVGFSGGSYSGNGFGYGISSLGGATNNVRVRNIAVFGVLSNGIDLGFGGTSVDGCSVTTAGGYGIYADSVSNSTSRNTGNSAILTNSALNCTGSSNGNDGVQATTATNCYGTAVGSNNTGHGVSANSSVNCYGTAAGSGHGINGNTALNCYGSSTGTGKGVNVDVATGCEGINTGTGIGILASVANGCRATASNNTGLMVTEMAANSSGIGTVGIDSGGTATNCFAHGTSGTGLNCQIATGCYASGAGTGINAKYSVTGSLGDATVNPSGVGISAIPGGDGTSVVAYSVGLVQDLSPLGSNNAISASIIYSCGKGHVNSVFNGHRYFDDTGANPYP